MSVEDFRTREHKYLAEAVTKAAQLRSRRATTADASRPSDEQPPASDTPSATRSDPVSTRTRQAADDGWSQPLKGLRRCLFMPYPKYTSIAKGA